MGFRVSTPDQTLGYNRSTDWPMAGGVGPGIGDNVSNLLTTPVGSDTNSSTWHPTILWMFGFVIAEMVTFHLLSKYLNL